MRAWIATAFVFLAMAGPASAVVVHPSVAPSVLRGSGPWDVTYKVELDAGSAPEQVTLSAVNAFGALPDPVVDGPATQTKGPQLLGIADRFCSSGGSLAFQSAQAEWTVALPANSVSVLSFTVQVDRRFGIGDTTFQDVSFTLDGAPVAIAGPAIVAPRDPGISLSASGKQGDRVAIRGRTTPLLSGQRIDLRAGALRPTTTIARVRVRADGSFAYGSWRPAAGRWTIGAYYDSHDPRFVDRAVAGCLPVVYVGR